MTNPRSLNCLNDLCELCGEKATSKLTGKRFVGGVEVFGANDWCALARARF